MRGTPGRERRLSPRERGWLDVDTVRGIGPFTGITADGLRDALVRLHRRHPTHPAVCRLDRDRLRWIPVSEPEFAAGVRDMVLDLAPRGDQPAEYAAHRLMDEPARDRPVLLAVCDRYVAKRMAHCVGDGRVSNTLLPGLIRAAATGAEVEPLPSPAPRLPLTRALLRHIGTRPWRIAEVRIRRPPATGAGAPTMPWHPSLAHRSSRSDRRLLPAIRAWRDRTLPGVTIAVIVFSALAAAFDRVGLGTDQPGMVVLVDGRRYLKKSDDVGGNLSTGQYLIPERLSDPRAVDRALRAELASGSALAMMALRDLHLMVSRRHGHPPAADRVRRAARPALTLTHIGRLTELTDLPWDAKPEDRVNVSIPSPAGPEAITISVSEMVGILHLNATFHDTTFDPELVRAALDLVVTDPIGLVHPPSRRVTPAAGRPAVA